MYCTHYFEMILQDAKEKSARKEHVMVGICKYLSPDVMNTIFKLKQNIVTKYLHILGSQNPEI